MVSPEVLSTTLISSRKKKWKKKLPYLNRLSFSVCLTNYTCNESFIIHLLMAIFI